VADNRTLPLTGAGDATAVVATDDVGGVHYQRVKLDAGADGVSLPVDATNPLPVAGAVTVPAGVAVTGTVTANAGTNLNTSALALESTLSTYTGNQRASAASVDGSQVSVTASAGGTQVLASNANRKGFVLYFVNSCWLSFGGTPTSSFFLCPAGTVFEMLSGLIYTGAITALSVSGTATVHRVEF
jgi:hypothetical protein